MTGPIGKARSGVVAGFIVEKINLRFSFTELDSP
jgi:hypothetical protein